VLPGCTRSQQLEEQAPLAKVGSSRFYFYSLVLRVVNRDLQHVKEFI
jgi:hypothetical protein